MLVLVGCEESQAVTIEFRRMGHEAYSCDTLPCSGGHPEWHLQMDVYEAIKLKPWDKGVFFPPCTHIAVSGARYFEAKRLDGRQEAAIKFFIDLYYCDIPEVSIENPIGIMGGGQYLKQHFSHLDLRGFPMKPTQIIQPWQYGHGETKATCLWLRGLQTLKPTNVVEGREQRIWKMSPGPQRGAERSKTYPGIAKAMAYYWDDMLF